MVALWEWISNEISNFSYHEGFVQGSSAYRQAMTTHQPAGTPISLLSTMISIQTRLPGPSMITFKAWKIHSGAMGRGQSAYMIGAYGSGLTCSWLLNHNMAERCWLSGSRGWSGYEKFNDWDIRQAFDDLNIPGLAAGVEGDYNSDVGKSSYGGFQVLT